MVTRMGEMGSELYRLDTPRRLLLLLLPLLGTVSGDCCQFTAREYVEYCYKLKSIHRVIASIVVYKFESWSCDIGKNSHFCSSNQC